MKIENLNFSNYCLPSQIYLVFAILTILMNQFRKLKLFLLFVNILLAIIWAWILNFLCSEGYEVVSWILLFLPFILFLLFIMYIYILKSRGIHVKFNNTNFTTMLT